MESFEPPVYVVIPGKSYRADAIDASHLPVFHQSRSSRSIAT